jgi:hypothetical protein
MTEAVISQTLKLYIHQLTDSDIIGVWFKNGKKGQIIKISPDLYISVIFGESNCYTRKVKGTSIENLVGILSEYNKYYSFNNQGEFIKWISDQ